MDIDDITLEDKQTLNIGTGSKLHIFIKDVTIPVSSIFIGMKLNEYVIMTIPTPFQTIKHKMFKGSQMVIKYLYEGTVYAFQTQMIGVVSEPIKIIAVEFPHLVQSYGLRLLKRINCSIPSKFIIEEEIIDTTIKDISKKGCKCIIKTGETKKLTIAKGKEIILKCQFPGLNEAQTIIGKIRNIQHIEENKDTEIGVEFNKMSSNTKNLIAQYIVSFGIF